MATIVEAGDRGEGAVATVVASSRVVEVSNRSMVVSPDELKWIIGARGGGEGRG